MTAWRAWTALTDLADQAVVLPLALLVFAALRVRDREGGRTARGWALAVGGVLLSLLALKLWAGACAGLPGAAGVRSPSGHTAAGGIVYGGLIALALRRGAVGSALCCLGMAAVFGASRLALGMHTPPEVAVGCVVAAAGGVVLARAGRGTAPVVRRQGRATWGRSDTWAWVAAALALVWTLHGRRLPAEPVIAEVASAWLSPLCRW